MINYLIYIADFLVIIGFIAYFLLIICSNKKVSKGDGFNITKDVLNEYNSINIVENKGFLTVYNIRRKVIKIASRCYYGNSIGDVAIPLMEAGISIVDNHKNKFISFISKIRPNLKFLYILPAIAVLFNSVAAIDDAKLGLIITFIFIIISYMLINVKMEALNLIGNKLSNSKILNKEDNVSVMKFLNRIILFDKFIFIGELVMVVRFVAVMLKVW